MAELLVVNEASLPFKTLSDCNENIDNIFDLLHEARLGNLSFCRADGYEGDWCRLNYAEGFEFGSWLNSITDRDKERQVKSVLSSVRCPLRSLSDMETDSQSEDILFYLESDDSVELFGLGYAHLQDKYSLSFSSDQAWINDTISIMKVYDRDGTVHIESATVRNIASKEHILTYLENLEESRKQNKAFLSSLTNKDNDVFPNLLFSDSVLKSFKSNTLQAVDFFRLLDVLDKLDKSVTASANTAELSTNSGLSITGESSSTMDNRALVRMRTFKHPEDGKVVFEDHVKNFPNAKRMHILADYESNKICIGYFGAHLKTSSS